MTEFESVIKLQGGGRGAPDGPGVHCMEKRRRREMAGKGAIRQGRRGEVSKDKQERSKEEERIARAKRRETPIEELTEKRSNSQ